MSWQRAVNDIQGLLTQGGTPTNHASDIAARLSFALEDYYNFRQAQGNSQDISASSSKTPAFKNAFRSPEEYPGGDPGADGQGAYAWAVGQDGKDGTGQDGTNGQDGASGQDGATGFGGGLTIDISRVPCGALEAKLKSCGLSTGKDGQDGKTKCPPGGPFPGQEICSILDQQAKEIGKLRRELDTLKDAVKAIEKQLADAVDCP